MKSYIKKLKTYRPTNKTIIKLSGFQPVAQTNQCGDIFWQKSRTCFTHDVPGGTKQPFAWHRCGRDTQYSFYKVCKNRKTIPI